MDKINTNQLRPGDYFMIRGRISFSRITRFITKEEFDRDNQNRITSGRPVESRPYAHVSLKNAVVICGDPNNKTLIEQYAEQKLFAGRDPAAGMQFNAKKTGTFETDPATGKTYVTGYLPTVWTIGPDGKTFQQIKAEAELANGLDVMVVMSVYKATPNNGVALDRIMCMEPIRYFSAGNDITQALINSGLCMVPDASIVNKVSLADYTRGTAAAQPQAQAAPQPTAAPAPTYAPPVPDTAPGQAAPVAPNYFSTAPAQAAAAPQTAAAPQPGYPDPMAAQNQPPVQPPVQAPAQAPAQAPVPPFGVPPTAFPGGAAAAPGTIPYDPNVDATRQY